MSSWIMTKTQSDILVTHLPVPGVQSVAQTQIGEKYKEKERERGGRGREKVSLPSLPTPPFSHPSLRAVPTHNLNAWNRLVTHENSSNIPLTYAHIQIRTYG